MGELIHLDRNAGRSFWLLTDLFTFKVTGEESGGTLAVAELLAPPDGGPPPHIHRNADEGFYVLEGTFEFSLDGRVFSAGSGSFVYLPKNVVHTHRAGGGKPARALVFQSPAGVERFIQEAGRPAPDISSEPVPPSAQDIERVVSMARQHGIDVPPMS